MIGAAVLVDGDYERLMLPDKVLRLHPNEAIERGFLLHALRSADARQYIEENATGIDVRNISQAKLAGVPVSLPPLREQRRIVAKLDVLLARSKKAREHLDRLPALLDALKRSILAAAFRGDLTADWRKANPDVEPATKLLERIRAERRRRWEEELRAKGKDPKKAKYEEPAPVDESELPELPEGWCWGSLDLLSEIQGGIQKQPSRAPHNNAFPFLRVANVLRGSLDLTEVHRIELFDRELDRLRLRAGDLLVVEGNGSATEIGRMAIWRGAIDDCVHQNHLIRVRLCPDLRPEIAEAFWNSPVGAAQVVATAVTTAGLFNLSVRRVAALPIPVMPDTEAAELVRALGLHMARVDRLHAVLRHLRKHTATSEESLLRAAFRGELVDQDPNEEPASALLDRVRAAQPAPTARRPRSPRENANVPAERAKGASEAEAIDLVVGVLVGGDALSAERIRVLTALGKDDVKTVLRGLVDAGKVQVQGRARGTSYSWVG